MSDKNPFGVFAALSDLANIPAENRRHVSTMTQNEGEHEPMTAENLSTGNIDDDPRQEENFLDHAARSTRRGTKNFSLRTRSNF